MIPFQVVPQLGVELEEFLQGHLGQRLALRLPELEQLAHPLAVQLHPLSPKLHQRRLSVDELAPLLLGDRVTVDSQLILISDERIQTEVADASRSGPLGWPRSGPQTDPHALAALRRPPRRHDHAVARVFEHPGALL